MRYIPDLIPERSKVLPEYFKGERYSEARESSNSNALFTVVAVITFLASLAFFSHGFVFLFLIFSGFVVLPHSRSFIEKNLKFEYTPKIKTGVCLLLIACAAHMIMQSRAADRQMAIAVQMESEKIEKAQFEEGRQEKLRHDTLLAYKFLGMAYIREEKPDSAVLFLDRALSYSKNPEEKEGIENEKARASSLGIQLLVKKGAYADALQQVNTLLVQNSGATALLYQRAVCYSKLGKIQDAVNDLQVPMERGFKGAEELHEKINPIRKRISYYLTRCCDGSASPSNAKGRGACSHHGGVCDWNEPVYEEYRQY